MLCDTPQEEQPQKLHSAPAQGQPVFPRVMNQLLQSAEAQGLPVFPQVMDQLIQSAAAQGPPLLAEHLLVFFQVIKHLLYQSS